MSGVVEIERHIREPYNPPARRGATRPRQQIRVARGVRETDGPCGSGRPVVEPPQAMRNLRRADFPRELECRQSPRRTMRPMRRTACLKRYFRPRAQRRRMPPERACALRNALQHIRRRRDNRLNQRHLRMDVEQRLATRCGASACLQAIEGHGVALVAVAQERELATCRRFSEPRIAPRQRDGPPLFGNLPFEAYVGKRPLQPMGDSEWATIIAHERGCVDDEAEGVFRRRHLSTP